MKRTVVDISTKVGEVINIVPIFDTHILSPTFDKRMYQQIVDFIRRTPNTYWFGGGDYGEYINFKDKRFDPSHCYPDLKVRDLADIVKKEIEIFEETSQSILNPRKCLGLGSGNHDNKLNKDGFGHIAQNMCKKYNLRYLGVSGFMKLLFQKFHSSTFRKFEIYYHHGWSAPRTPGGRVNNLYKMVMEHQCDLALTGHSHSKESVIVDYQTFGGPIKKVGLLCGAFKTGVDWDVETWEETRGYDQSKYNLGTWLIQLRPYPTSGGKFDFRFVDLDLNWV